MFQPSSMRRLLLLTPLLVATLGSSPSQQAPAAEPTVHRVSIRGMVFVPATLDVRVGDTIEWVNDDFVPHTVTASARNPSGPLFDSGVMAVKAPFRLVAKTAGEFPYVCTLHPTMKGSFKVK